jgi:hypothetical protein
MARRKLTDAAEAQLVASAESDRDNPERVLRRSEVRVSTEASGVLSVRLPLDQIRALRQEAVKRGVSLSDLLQEAVNRFLGSPGGEVSTSKFLQRVFIYSGGGMPIARTEPMVPSTNSYQEQVKTA